MELTRKEVGKMVWLQLQNAKFKEFYVELLLEKYQKLDKTINIYLVIATSSAVSAWAISKNDWFQWIWAIIVGISQIIILIRPYLNYSKYIKELNEKFYKLQAINLSYQKLWHDIKFDKTSPDEAASKDFEIRKSINDVLVFSDGLIMPENIKYSEKATSKLLSYLRITFNYKINQDEAN